MRSLTLAPRSRFAPLGFAAALLAVALIGCGRSSDTPETKTEPPKMEGAKTEAPKTEGGSGGFGPVADLKVALITPGSPNDGGWNQDAFDALQEIKKELGVEVQNVEAKTAGEQEENLRAYAQKGFQIVIAHGGELESLAQKVGKDFPKTLFLITGGREAGANTMPIIIDLGEAAYLQGMIAASMSKTGKIGSVGAMPLASLKEVFDAYEKGAKAVKPDITVIAPTYTNDWGDVAKAKQQTQALIAQGADVILHDLDAAATGVFKAVEESNKPDKPVWALASNKDQNAVSPNVILASSTINLKKAFVPIAKQVKESGFKPSGTPLGLKSEVVGFVSNSQLESKWAPDLKAKVEEAKTKILDGSLKVK